MIRFARQCLESIPIQLYYLTSFLCSAAVLFLRSYNAFLHPVAGWEDTTQGLNYYTSSEPSVLHYYAGYISFLPNVFDWASVKLLPLQAVPFAQEYFGLAAAACVAPALLSFFRNTVRWRSSHSAVTAILITCLPWGDVAAISNTEFSIWSLLTILLLTALNPITPSFLGRSYFVIWRTTIIASNPVAIICAPIWCYRAWKERNSHLQVAPYVLLLLVNLAYLRYGINHSFGSKIAPHQILDGLNAALRLATEKSFLAITVRDVLRINFGTVQGLAAALTLGVIAVLVWSIVPKPDRTSQQIRFTLIFLLGLIAAVCLACGLGRGTANGTAFVLSSPRYHYVPQILWFTVLAVVLHARAYSLRRFRLPFVVLVLICISLIWGKGLKAYRSDNYKESQEIIKFLKFAEANRSLGTLSEIRYSRSGPDDDWSIILFSKTNPAHNF